MSDIEQALLRYALGMHESGHPMIAEAIVRGADEITRLTSELATERARREAAESEHDEIVRKYEVERQEHAATHAKFDGAVPKWKFDQQCSMTKDALAERDRARVACGVAAADGVWFWQGRDDRSESLTCPVVMSAETLRGFVAERARREAAERDAYERGVEDAVAFLRKRAEGTKAIDMVSAGTLRAAWEQIERQMLAHPATAADDASDPQHPAYALGRRDGIALSAIAAGLDRESLEAAIDEGTAAAIAPAAGEGERDEERCCEFIWCYSNDPERYEAQCATREAAIAEATTEYDGAPFYVQKFRRPDVTEYAPDADDIIEMMRDRACDDAGEAAEEFPDVGDDATAELDAMLCAWARKRCVVTFWTSDGCGAEERIDPNAPAATGKGGER